MGLCAGFCQGGLIRAEDGVTDVAATAALQVPAEHVVRWLSSLDTAKEQARIRRAPILVKAGAEWCGYCRKLDEEIRKPQIQDELQRWLPVEVNVDRAPRVARELGIGPIPALCVLTPDGRLVATHEGFLPADELARWLADQHDAAALSLAAELSDVGPPSAVAVIRILREFDRRDATLREAAIARLAPYPETAAAHVLARFLAGTLSERLTALELLVMWSAPVEGLDPWEPDSLTDGRLTRLDAWLKERDFSTPNGSGLTPAELVDAERLIRMMTTADAAAAASMREQLARMGTGVLPLIRDALERADDDAARTRLTAARYRLAASGERVLTWRGGIERLASQDFDERVSAVEELAASAIPADEALLLTLFSDPAPLIREMALRALNQTTGQQADSVLVRLLDDPDANVRAAVLKALAESPSPQLVPKIAAYVKDEHDPDLIVHAVRFLKEVKRRTAVAALLGLFPHPSWRVRAEAAEGVAQLISEQEWKSPLDHTAIQNGFIGLLDDEDPFVVSRAAAGLEASSTIRAVNPLIQAAKTHQETAPEIIRVLIGNPAYRDKALPYLKAACRNESAEVRAAAIAGLVTHEGEKALPELEQALDDGEASVRIAVLDSLFESLCMAIDGLQAAASEATFVPSQSSWRIFGGGFISWLIEGRSGSRPIEERTGNTTDAVELPEAERSLQSIREKRRLPEWYYTSKPWVLPLLKAENVEERVSAARVLALLGHAESQSVLVQSAGEPALFEKISACLPRLAWNERQTLYDALASTTNSASMLAHAAEQMAMVPDSRTAARVWDLLARPGADQRLVSGLTAPLARTYFTGNFYNMEDSPPETRERFTGDCARYAAEGTPWQRLTAVLLLMQIDKQATVPLAEAIFDAEDLLREIRNDALQVLLSCEDDADAVNRSIDLLGAREPEFAETALAYLALGDEGLAAVIESTIHTINWGIEPAWSPVESGPIVPEVPENLSADQLERFLGSSNPRIAAHAGYLRALLGDLDGLPDVIAAWESAPQDANSGRLAYRAIARLNDRASVPVLERIYVQLRSDPYATYEVREFYWTIRTMTGPPVLELRKQIRRDYGADILR